ncbi:Oxygen regulatory protein NreC [Fundidesulfovibrio magnetotacticus]|uniref:Oxygen regulatory protein NreC n=1 Tax=Fundidesulfovibrio magnetotacticus TaxID=2730080 RepID=A0A6V8LNS2_9BACT|nr:response regulator transcription factor [Fundidesulfovibrio magnetotacticus]GFK94252.1 Oxygen regulatory protein NreC [Fundidesulfovibrio magnetotacticus]
MTRPRRVLVVDDHAVVRRGVVDILAAALPGCSFAEASGVALALAALEDPYDLAVLDISLPDGSGLDLLEWIAVNRPGLPVLVLSMHQEAEYARRALALGARGYLGKNSAPRELTEALACVLEGQTYVSPGLSPGLAPRQDPLAALSRREREVMRLLAQGRTVSDIARDLNLSVKTASTYRSRIMRKLGLRTAADFYRRALTMGLMD